MNKQVIIVRHDLKMPVGKIAAQSAHASMKAVFDSCNRDLEIFDEGTLEYIRVPLDDRNIGPWLRGDFTKVVCRVDSQNELEELIAQAQEAGLPAAVIVDNGKTVFNGVHTMTCGAVGPAPIDVVDKITGHLKLLY